MITKFTIELDYGAIGCKIHEGGLDLSLLGHMIKSLQDFFCYSSHSRLKFLSRKSNVLSHLLANHACDISYLK